MKDILLAILLFLCAGLAIWAMYLDNRLFQLLGYIDRVKMQRTLSVQDLLDYIHLCEKGECRRARAIELLKEWENK